MAINKPGVRQLDDDTCVVQMAKRSQQLEGIADVLESLEKYKSNVSPDNVSIPPDTLSVPYEVIHRLVGYANTLGIIADELKNIGK